LILHRSVNGDDAALWLAEKTGACALELPFTVGEQGLDGLPELYRGLVARLTEAAEQCHGGD
jgi:zinc/manganese transport system substrate-binding protein